MAITWDVDIDLINTIGLNTRTACWTRRGDGSYTYRGSNTSNASVTWGNTLTGLAYTAVGVNTSYYWQDYYTIYNLPVFKCANYSNYTYDSASFANFVTMCTTVENNGDFVTEYVTPTTTTEPLDGTTSLVNAVGFDTTTTDYKRVKCWIGILAQFICPQYKNYNAPTLTNCTAEFEYSTDGTTFQTVDYKTGTSYYWQLYPYYRWTITPDNGYKYDTFTAWTAFDNAYNYTITTSDSSTVITAVCKLVTKSDFTFTDYLALVNATFDPITYTVTCTEGGTVYSTISTTQTLSNCTTDIPSTITLDYTSYIYNITADDDYYFATTPTAIITYSDGTTLDLAITLSTDTTACSFTITTTDIQTDLSPTLTVVATAIKQVTDLTKIDKTLGHCSTDVPDTIDLSVITTYTWTVTATSGYYFDNAPTLGYFDVYLDPQIYTFSLSDDQTIATLTVDTSHMYTDSSDIASYPLTLVANAVKSSSYTDKYGIINVYHVTIDNLSDFADQRFTSDTSVDYGNYVLALFKLYCNITDSDTSLLQVGHYTTDITVGVPSTNVVTSDCGTITLTAYNNTSVDYISDIKLILPCYGIYNLDTRYIGMSLGVTYYTSIVTGSTSIIITANSHVIEVLDADMRQDIVYVTSNYPHGNLQQTSKSTFGFNTCAVITYYTDTNKSIDLPAQMHITKLSTLTSGAYVQLSNISNIDNTYLTSQEVDDLINLLQSGFYI